MTVACPQFGDLLRNTMASESNPTRDGYFVREVRRTGRFNPGLWFEMTDGKGKVWSIAAANAVLIKSSPIRGSA